MALNNNKIKWLVPGDINGFFALISDNLAVIAFLSLILIEAFHFPKDIVVKCIIPGTAFGVFLGDIILTFWGYYLCKKLGRKDITAMPLGLDTPSAIGLTLTVVGPAFIAMTHKGLDPHAAGIAAWQIGMAGVVIIGLLKLMAVMLGNIIQKIVPLAGLLGSLAGVCVGLIGFIPLMGIFKSPVVGMIALGLILYTLIARIPFPKRIPGVLAAIVIGTTVYHFLGYFGADPGVYTKPSFDFYFGLPIPTLGFVNGFQHVLEYLPIILPFAILTIVGNINVTASAAAAGDPYKAKNILLIDGLVTTISGICGSISQTTGYIGQPAYKRMGARLGYTMATGLFIGLGGVFGYISFFVDFIPTAVLAPILIFVALDIMAQAFIAPPRRHVAAVGFAIFPSVARLVSLYLLNPAIIATPTLLKLISANEHGLPDVLVIIALGSGFILVGMLWGGCLAEIIDRKLKTASVYLFILAVLSFFGLVHSADINGSTYFPWHLTGTQMQLAYCFTLGYAILGVIILLLSFTKSAKHALPIEQDEVLF